MTKKTRRAKARRALLTLSLVLVMMMVAVGGTIAWLTDKTETVTNTFTHSEIDITLTETTGTTYDMLPGTTIAKDPKVTVKAGSEAAWLFVKIDETTDLDNYITYTVDSDWTQLKDADNNNVEGVYYREVATVTADTPYNVIANNQVTVKTDVTNAMMKAVKEDTDKVQLTFTAYAVQKEAAANATAAWAIAQDNAKTVVYDGTITANN